MSPFINRQHFVYKYKRSISKNIYLNQELALNSIEWFSCLKWLKHNQIGPKYLVDSPKNNPVYIIMISISPDFPSCIHITHPLGAV